jgi:nicotinamidase-related amidase
VWAAHPHPELVVATRIEHVVTEILRFVRLRRAYSVWVENGRPENTALDDWLKAESEIRALA